MYYSTFFQCTTLAISINKHTVLWFKLPYFCVKLPISELYTDFSSIQTWPFYTLFNFFGWLCYSFKTHICLTKSDVFLLSGYHYISIMFHSQQYTFVQFVKIQDNRLQNTFIKTRDLIYWFWFKCHFKIVQVQINFNRS